MVYSHRISAGEEDRFEACDRGKLPAIPTDREPCRVVLETSAETGRGVHFSRLLSEARWAELRAESAEQESDNTINSSSSTSSSESDNDSICSKSIEGTPKKPSQSR